jgi:methionine salvage enolase-phosphatase E1
VENKFDFKGYERIQERTGIKEWTFFSDVAQEVASAKKSGMQGYVVVREGNKPLTESETAEHTLLEAGLTEIVEELIAGS